MSLGWRIVDRETGRPVSRLLFLTRQLAEDHITRLQNGYEVGTVVIPREELLRMDPVPS